MGIIIKPIITEKQTQITGKKSNCVGFYVSPSADKLEIRTAVSGLYDVSVLRVNTMNYDGKRKSRYNKLKVMKGKRVALKKAIVILSKGETIDFFSGNIK
ncbi:MAG: 50S ribosomal protein L23 [Candidatus Azobacteroides pseudotrichonymphae]|jgi:large subunit ribosomal protein L23|nr:50S ribosomal protein L23 [Bacteroidales bacterium OttesenSCG-928-I14]GMO36875.1 MAG: 50S ribosomal protein L23 [Candidatus Azobacteroides pseudotrichonymphae]